MKRFLIFFAACISVSTLAQAEVLLGINYNATLGDIKKIYPNASYEKLKPAWLNEKSAFIKISGSGLGGVLRVAFDDLRPTAKKMLESDPGNNFYREYSTSTDDHALTVDWVRLTYTTPVALDTFKKRYGPPSKCEHNESFNLECKWPDKSLVASMSDDGKFVQMATTGFTLKEKQMGYTVKGMDIPDWLQ